MNARHPLARTARLPVFCEPGPYLCLCQLRAGNGCLQIAQRALEQAGAELESGDTESKRMTVRFDPARLSRADVVAAMEAVGFAPDEEAS